MKKDITAAILVGLAVSFVFLIINLALDYMQSLGEIQYALGLVFLLIMPSLICLGIALWPYLSDDKKDE